MFSTDNITSRRGRTLAVLVALAPAAFAVISAVSSHSDSGLQPSAGAKVRVPALQPSAGAKVRVWTIQYRSHAGVERSATLLLPDWYGPKKNPPIPLVISPHGRNGTGRGNAEYWGTLPGIGGFAVVNPDGMGRRLTYNSYGYRAEIDDLARMPRFVKVALPWIRIDRRQIFALGSSMGGQETLLLVARHPELLAGAAAMDSVTDLARRYRQMPANLQNKVAREIGGSPARHPRRYSERSPLQLAERIVSSGVPLQIWWSTKDHIVVDQKHQSGALYHELRRLDRCAPVSEYVGTWRHSHEMRSGQLLPITLVRLGLLSRTTRALPADVTYHAAPECTNL
jgi:dipeptidyl aminopeptidase/acylaminoacyl peptidase